MSETNVCRRCGYAGPADARYCARCGRSLVPFGTHLADCANRLLDGVSPLHVALLGLVALVPLGWLANHFLVHTGLYLRSSLLLLALIIGLGGAYVGWLWKMPLSNRRRLVRVLIVFAAMGLLLAAVWGLDTVLSVLLADGGRVIVLDIPGVHLEASAGYRHVHIVSSPPPYWLVTMGYVILCAVAGSMIYKVYANRPNAG
jgi:hypothetical protein